MESVRAEFGTKQPVQYALNVDDNSGMQYATDGNQAVWLDRSPSGLPWSLQIGMDGTQFITDGLSAKSLSELLPVAGTPTSSSPTSGSNNVNIV